MALESKGLATRDYGHLAPESAYRGNIWASSYLGQAENLPDNENCALWIEGIPENTPHSVIFDNIHCGTIWCLHFNPVTESHSTMAAKIVFTKSESAAAVIQKYRAFGIQLRRNQLKLYYNRHGMRAKNTTETHVLLIEGPAEKMTWEKWEPYFDEACVSQMDR